MALEFLPQCCDAEGYLYMGKLCAADGICFDKLRPMGTLYWFSIPYRLGLDPSFLIYLHLALLGLAVFLSVRAFLAIAARLKVNMTPVMTAGFSLFSFLVHGTFFYPYLRQSLTDAPAGLLAMCGLWTLILYRRYNHYLPILLAGLFLGLAAGIRFFYVYPLCVLLAVYFFFWLRDNGRRYRDLILLVALGPVLFQYGNVYVRHGDWGYMTKDMTEAWSEFHLQAHVVGFDSTTDRDSRGWFNESSLTHEGIREALLEGDIAAAGGIVAGKLNFYLGSYLKTAYMIAPEYENEYVNQLRYPERLDNYPAWGLHPETTLVERNVVIAPDGELTADAVRVTSNYPVFTGVLQAQLLNAGEIYAFSAWLWSDKPTTIEMAFRRSADDEPVYREKLVIDTTPTRYFINFKPDITENYQVFAGSLYDQQQGRVTVFGTNLEDRFYMWGAQLETGIIPTEYQSPPRLDKQRTWSYFILAPNLLAVLAAISFVLMNRKHLRRECYSAFIFAGLVLAQGIAVIPEQRFVIVFPVVAWMFAGFMVLQLCQRMPANRSGHP